MTGAFGQIGGGADTLQAQQPSAIAPQSYQTITENPPGTSPGTYSAPTLTLNPVPASVSSLAVGAAVFFHDRANALENGPWIVTNPATGELTRSFPNYGTGDTAYMGSLFTDHFTGIQYELQNTAVVDTDGQVWQQVITQGGLPIRVVHLDSTSPTYQIQDGPGHNILLVNTSGGNVGNSNATNNDGDTVSVGAILPANPSTDLTAPTIVEIRDVSDSFDGNNFVLSANGHNRNGAALADGLYEFDGVNTNAQLVYVNAAIGFAPNEVWLTSSGGSTDVEVVRNFRTVTLRATTAGVIPAGARSYTIQNLGENGLGGTFHPWTVAGNRFETVERVFGDSVAESQDSFEAIAYDPNPDGNAVPNVLRVIYQELVP